MTRYAVALFEMFDHKIHLSERVASSKLEAARAAIAEVWDGREELSEIPEIKTYEALVEYMNEDVLEVLELDGG